jgi:hypothetical protein
MKIRTILAAAAAPAALAAVLLGTAGQASAAVQQPTYSANFWNTNGHALKGPQQMPNNTVSFGSGYLATVTEKMNNADITGGKTITIKGTLKGGQFTDQANGGDTTGSNPTMRVYFQGGSAGTDANSPDGYEGQQWWADATPAMISLNGTTDFTLHITANPADPEGWCDWNGQQASANPDLFNAAASHVRDLGLSFGGGDFYENGVTGSGSLTITSITVN